MAILKIVISIILLLCGIGYYYFPKIIYKINSFFRKYLFNDNFILNYNKKIGLFFIVTSLVGFYIGFTGLMRTKDIKIPGLNQQDLNLYQALQLISNHKYDAAILIYEDILRTNPGNIRALANIGLAYYLKEDHNRARQFWEQGLRIEPDNKEIKSLMSAYFK